MANPVGVYFDDDVGMVHSPEWVEVTETEDEAEFIGLYDHDGDPLYRVPERLPIGLHHRDPA